MRRKVFLFAVLLILVSLSIAPAAAFGPPPTEEERIIKFLGPDIESSEITMMARRARGGKNLDLIDKLDAYLTFDWGNENPWQGDKYGRLGVFIDLKTSEVEMGYDFDWYDEGDHRIPSYSLQGTGGIYDDDANTIVFSGTQFTIYKVFYLPPKGKGNKGYGLDYEPVASPELSFTVSIGE